MGHERLWSTRAEPTSTGVSYVDWLSTALRLDCLGIKTSLTGTMNRRLGATPCEGTRPTGGQRMVHGQDAFGG